MEIIFSVSLAIGVFFVCRYLRKINTNLLDMSNKLVSLYDEDSQKGGTVLLPVTKMDLKTECTTVLPLPIGAEVCSHTMEKLNETILRAPHEERCIIILQCIKCGAIDKTFSVTSMPPVVPPSKSECRHNWVKEKTVTLPSAFEQMEELLKEQSSRGKHYRPFYPNKNTKPTSGTEVTSPENLDLTERWMFRKTIIKERVCSKCGEVDRMVASNFDAEEENVSTPPS